MHPKLMTFSTCVTRVDTKLYVNKRLSFIVRVARFQTIDASEEYPGRNSDFDERVNSGSSKNSSDCTNFFRRKWYCWLQWFSHLLKAILYVRNLGCPKRRVMPHTCSFDDKKYRNKSSQASAGKMFENKESDKVYHLKQISYLRQSLNILMQNKNGPV